MQKRVYKTVFGLETGDIVTTSYNTGPYEVIDLTAPRYVSSDFGSLFIHRFPIFSIICGDPPGGHRQYPTPLGNPAGYLNGICFVDGRFLCWDGKDEVFVKKSKPLYDQVIDMFASYPMPVDKPYVWQAGVDYSAQVFNCQHCGGIDFNYSGVVAWQCNPKCAQCGRVSRRVYVRGFDLQ